MKLSGEENKLQALFSELKAAEEETAPRFATIWNRAALKPRRVRSFNPALVAASALVVCAVLSLAVWLRYRQQAQPTQLAHVETPVAPHTELPSVPPRVAEVATPTAPRSKESIVRRRNRPALRHNGPEVATNRKLTQEAKAISDWSSPTSTLMSSPSDSLFSSLPQLNENSNGLQSYLPSRPN
jgi:hypothetical protein